MKFRIVILAAGKGTRMKQEIPKALTPVGGKPILQHLLESIEQSGLDTNPVLVIGKDSPKMGDVLGKVCDHAIQESQLGTGHAVRCTEDHVEGADALIVLYGDHPFLSASTLNRLASTHTEAQQGQETSPITMATTKIPSTEGWYHAFEKWGRILRDASGSVIGNRQFKDATDEEKQILERDPALFCFRTDWLWDRLARLKNENAQGEYYLTDLVAMAFEEGLKIPTVSIPPEEAIGINTPEEKEIAEEILRKRIL
jgi:bifunctional UDP-N-acetylglucosamine pyrophosphorylase/glucosamine-1-phosphate N-acetyltransferase